MHNTGRWTRRAALASGGLVVLVRAGAWAKPARALPEVRFQARVIGAGDAPLGAVPAAIGEGDTIVGSLTTEAGTGAFANRGRALRLLTGEGQVSAARAVNGRGAIAGSVAGKAVVWRDDEVIALDTLGGETGEAFGISDDGLSVGQAATADGRTHAVLWQRGGTARSLSADDVALSVAYAINADGVVVGVTAVGGTGRAEHAARWVDGELTDLGTRRRRRQPGHRDQRRGRGRRLVEHRHGLRRHRPRRPVGRRRDRRPRRPRPG
jgi:probable HAF family extracellular repeat protein